MTLCIDNGIGLGTTELWKHEEYFIRRKQINLQLQGLLLNVTGDPKLY